MLYLIDLLVNIVLITAYVIVTLVVLPDILSTIKERQITRGDRLLPYILFNVVMYVLVTQLYGMGYMTVLYSLVSNLFTLMLCIMFLLALVVVGRAIYGLTRLLIG